MVGEKVEGRRLLEEVWGARETSEYSEWLRELPNPELESVKVKVAQSSLTLCNPMDYTVHGIVGQNTGVGSLSLLQGIFPTQGWNPGLPHCRWILYQLSHRGSPDLEDSG